jgi:hypothetical protein
VRKPAKSLEQGGIVFLQRTDGVRNEGQNTELASELLSSPPAGPHLMSARSPLRARSGTAHDGATLNSNRLWGATGIKEPLCWALDVRVQPKLCPSGRSFFSLAARRTSVVWPVVSW